MVASERLSRVVAGCVLAVAAASCTTTDPAVPESDAPFVYIVLDPMGYNGLGTSSQYAVVLTVGTPVLAPCRSVQQIAMWRDVDGAPFAWRIQPECLGGALPSGISILGESCCVLPDSAATDSLLVRDLAGGDRLEIEIQTEGVVVRGSAVMPDTFSVRVVQREDGRREAVWPRVTGAAAYLVEGVMLQDTSRVLAAGSRSIEVIALDANVHAYLADPRTARAGLVNAFGVFGAVTRAGLNF